MEDDQRPFQAVSIDMACTETGAERFVRDNLFMPPPISNWRCNLTALSRRYNLYFVASRSGIAVYQPDFPFQKLKRTPKLFILPTLANPTAPGYIDERHPHAINHLVVGNLGSEEILLASTDSGNVTAYHTRSIEDAIKKDPYKFSTDARSDFVGLRAFFSQWVKESAWGLAIHQEARMIAVSANTPRHALFADNSDSRAEITVFAFALTEQDDESQEHEQIIDVEAGLGDSEWSEWSAVDAGVDVPARDRNYKVVLSGRGGHIFNVPSISFVNSSSDTQGIWLLSTDISGCLKVWQIWRRRCRTSWQLPEDTDFNPRVDQAIHDESGWMIAALDPESFREACTMQQFCGHHSVRKLLDSESYDLSDIVRATIPDRSERHPLMSSSDEDEDPADDDEIADHLSDDEHTEANNRTVSRRLSTIPLEGANDGAHTARQAQWTSLNATNRGSGATTVLARNAMQQDIEELLLDHYNSELEDSDEDFDRDSRTGELDDGTSDEQTSGSSGSVASRTSFSNVSQRSSVGVGLEPMSLASPNSSNRPSPVDSIEVAKAKKRRRKQVTNEETEAPIPRIPLLHCSATNVRLYDIPARRRAHVFCHDPLQQQLPLALQVPHGHMRRLNMFQQIPELGVIIIGSQMGRIAVCALTRNGRTGTLGFRVDWLLPTKRQERAGQRPNCLLLGIAAAPIQGRQHEAPLLAVDDDRWGRDSSADGVKVSFDPGVFVFPETRWKQEGSDSEVEQQTQRASKRHRRTSTATTSTTSSSAASTEKRPWQRPASQPTYMENSRRFRVMLTYTDMTVLTYEISRQVEREDVAGASERNSS